MPGSDQDDLKSLILALSENVKTLQAVVKGNAQAIQRLEKQPPASSSTSSDGIPKQTDEHHIDRPPRFQKMDFPKYDCKSDPLAFINQCESYFDQQRIIEEKALMASYNLEDIAQMWFI